MGDLSVSTSRENQRGLDDLKADQDQKLRETRAEYKRKIADAQEAGDAAVNHIKRSTDERVDQTRADGSARLKNEVDSQHKTYADLKRRANQQNEQVQIKVEDTKAEARKNIEQARSEEARVLERNQQTMKEFIDQQNELKHDARVNTNKEIDGVRRQGAERIHEERAKSESELSSYRKDSHENLDRLRTHDTEVYAEAKTRDDQRLRDLREHGERETQSTQADMSRQLNQLSHRYQEASKQEHDRGEKDLHIAQKDEEHKLAAIREHGARVNQQTQTEYALESKRLQEEGKAELQYEQAKYQDLKKEQSLAFQAKLKQLDKNSAVEQEKAHREERARSQAEANAYETAMEHQRTEFNKNYESAAHANHESLATQKQAYLGALYKENAKFYEQLGILNSRAGDEFYRLKTFSPNLQDRPDSYVLHAQVEPYERENVEIIVRDNHITLSAKRAYKDDVKDGNTRTETNAYQTFRQEFKLDYPIDVARTYRNVDEYGRITVFAPKKGSGDGLVFNDSTIQRSEQGLGRV